jgi:hypothetical protein
MILDSMSSGLAGGAGLRRSLQVGRQLSLLRVAIERSWTAWINSASGTLGNGVHFKKSLLQYENTAESGTVHMITSPEL